MSSLLQFHGETGRRGVRLEFYLTEPHPDHPDLAVLGYTRDTCPCLRADRPDHRAGHTHPRIYVAWRKPVGMLGCWVQFRYNGGIYAPDLSLPIPVFKLPKGAKPIGDDETCRYWHRK